MAMVPETPLVREIKDALRRCKSVAEVNLTADHYRPQVKAMEKNRDHRVFAIQISNLKQISIKRILNDERR